MPGGSGKPRKTSVTAVNVQQRFEPRIPRIQFRNPKVPSKTLPGLTQLPSKWVSGFLPRVTRPEREVYHSLPSNAEVKNEWRNTSAPPIYLYCVNKYNFTVLLLETTCSFGCTQVYAVMPSPESMKIFADFRQKLGANV